jgi:hydroxyethylthiazole kinase-like uncharacterized protein yjeF
MVFGVKIVTSSQIKVAEKYAADNGISYLRLMENAGTAAARFIRDTVKVQNMSFIVICGRGNNGGDGFVAARKLSEQGANVKVILACGQPKTIDATEMFDRIKDLLLKIYDFNVYPQECISVIQECNYIVDAIFGTGFKGDAQGNLTTLIETINNNKNNKKIFSLDMPSGANADTGEIGDVCVKADFTITFAAPKIGQFASPAVEYCGILKTVYIGIPDYAFMLFNATSQLLDIKMIESMIPIRKLNSNKGDYGRVLCLCGSLGMSGAAFLACSGALRCGAGLVTAMVPKQIYNVVAVKLDEAMVFPVEGTEAGSFAYSNLEQILEFSKKSSVLLLGCGNSQNEETVQLMRELIKNATCPIVLDADGINAFAEHIDLLRESKADIIITPHPGEMARLTGKSVKEVQNNRLKVAAEFAAENYVYVVLKGANTVIATPDGKSFINSTGNPGMAKGGSGDILAGMIAAFVAQGFKLEDAACCGVFIHGFAGDKCAAKYSQYAMQPTDMLMEVPQIFSEISR